MLMVDGIMSVMISEVIDFGFGFERRILHLYLLASFGSTPLILRVQFEPPDIENLLLNALYTVVHELIGLNVSFIMRCQTILQCSLQLATPMSVGQVRTALARISATTSIGWPVSSHALPPQDNRENTAKATRNIFT